MELNRKLQKDILVALSEVYPDSLLVSALPGFSHNREFMGNLFYLQEHGVIDGGDIREPGQCRSMVDAQITKAGLDFLADDGGLSAILGYQFIKLEASALVDSLLKLLQEGEVEGDKYSIAEARLNTMDDAALANLVVELLRHGGSIYEALTSYLFNEQNPIPS
jgi:hypothetical protein